MKKSLLITYFFPPKIGGIENYLKNLCLRLPADKIAVFTEKDEAARAFDKNYPRKVIRRAIFPWRFFKPSWLPLLWQIKKIVREEKIDCLQFGHYFHIVTVGLILKKLFGLPYLVYTHGVDTLIPQKNGLKKKLMVLNLKNADYVVANTLFMKNKMIALGVFESRIIVVYPSLNLEEKELGDKINFLREKYSLFNKKVILTMGRLVKRKGQDMVIRALAKLVRTEPDLVYLIVGDGPDRIYLENLVKELELEKNVIFTGAIKDEYNLKTPYYLLADLFVMPTREIDEEKDVESFGLVYLEAQSQGRPVIVGRAGGTRETIIEGETGLTVNPESAEDIGEKILFLLKNESRRKEMGEKGKKWVRGFFNWDRQILKLKAVLDPPQVVKKENQPAISVIIPAYQALSSISGCLASLKKQTFQDFELIVVNDGPDPELPAVIKKHYPAAKILEKKHFSQKPSEAAKARNLGAGQAQGKYLFFCDADVILRPACLEKMVRTLEMNPGHSFCYSAFYFGRRKFKALPFSGHKLRQLNYISTMSLLKADKFPGFDENLSRLQDWDLWLTILERGGRGIAWPEALFSAPLRQAGISKSISRLEALKILAKKHGLEFS